MINIDKSLAGLLFFALSPTTHHNEPANDAMTNGLPSLGPCRIQVSPVEWMAMCELLAVR